MSEEEINAVLGEIQNDGGMPRTLDKWRRSRNGENHLGKNRDCTPGGGSSTNVHQYGCNDEASQEKTRLLAGTQTPAMERGYSCDSFESQPDTQPIDWDDLGGEQDGDSDTDSHSSQNFKEMGAASQNAVPDQQQSGLASSETSPIGAVVGPRSSPEQRTNRRSSTPRRSILGIGHNTVDRGIVPGGTGERADPYRIESDHSENGSTSINDCSSEIRKQRPLERAVSPIVATARRLFGKHQKDRGSINRSRRSKREGNTIPLSSSSSKPKKFRKQGSPAKKWVFTDFSSNEHRFDQWIELLETKLCKLAMQEEVCPKTFRKHIQGCFTMKKKGRPLTELKMQGTHYDLQRGTDAQAVAYSSKEETRLTEGRRFQQGYAEPIRLVQLSDLREQQIQIVNQFLAPCAWDSRTIYWFWEPFGHWGKTQLTKYFVHQKNALVLSGKRNDCLYGYVEFCEKLGDNPPLVIFDIPKCVDSQYVSYEGMEKLKDSIFFSPKYKGTMFIGKVPHVLCFANAPPDESKLSADRWNIVQLPDYDGPTC